MSSYILQNQDKPDTLKQFLDDCQLRGDILLSVKPRYHPMSYYLPYQNLFCHPWI